MLDFSTKRLIHDLESTADFNPGLAVTVSHRINSRQSCNVSGQICYLSGHKTLGQKYGY